MSSPQRSDHGLRRPLLLAALALTALVALAAPAGTSLDRVPLRAAGDLADSIGVVTHGSYADTPYADGDRVLGALKSLGIRHVRDGVSAGRDERLVRYLQQLGAAGIRFTLVTGPPDGSRGSVDQLLAVVRERLRASVESLEGLNEYDLGGGPDWAARATDYQRELYGKAKADPALRHVPILAPSVGRPADTAALRELRPFADDGNLHLYPGGLPPSAAEIRRALALAGQNGRSGATVVTETGYHDAVAQQGGQAPASERAAAVYIPRLCLEMFAAGARRTYLYELLDEHPDPADADQGRQFGLFRVDFSPKPAARSLGNLLGILGASGGSRPTPRGPRSLGLELTPASVHRLALRTGPDSLLLLLWRQSSVWDRDTRRDLPAGPPLRATARLARDYGRIELARVGTGARPVQRLPPGRKLELEVPADDILAVRLSDPR